jgi:hypothetical protein
LSEYKQEKNTFTRIWQKLTAFANPRGSQDGQFHFREGGFFPLDLADSSDAPGATHDATYRFKFVSKSLQRSLLTITPVERSLQAAHYYVLTIIQLLAFIGQRILSFRTVKTCVT